MKVIKWADIGTSLPDPVPAHLIPPKYVHELPSGNDRMRRALEATSSIAPQCDLRSGAFLFNRKRQFPDKHSGYCRFLLKPFQNKIFVFQK